MLSMQWSHPKAIGVTFTKLILYAPGILSLSVLTPNYIGFAVFRSSTSPVLGHFISLQLIGYINSPTTH